MPPAHDGTDWMRQVHEMRLAERRVVEAEQLEKEERVRKEAAEAAARDEAERKAAQLLEEEARVEQARKEAAALALRDKNKRHAEYVASSLPAGIPVYYLDHNNTQRQLGHVDKKPKKAAVVAAHDVCLNPNWRRGPCDAHALGNGEIEMCDDVWKRSGCTCRFAKTERPAVWQRSAVW